MPMLTVHYLAYFPSAGINVQNRHRISDEASRDVSQITFVVVEVKSERSVYMLQIVIEHFENSENCESAHGFLSAAYEIKRVTYKSVQFDYRVRACLYRLIFFQCITRCFFRAYRIIAVLAYLPSAREDAAKTRAEQRLSW